MSLLKNSFAELRHELDLRVKPILKISNHPLCFNLFYYICATLMFSFDITMFFRSPSIIPQSLPSALKFACAIWSCCCIN